MVHEIILFIHDRTCAADEQQCIAVVQLSHLVRCQQLFAYSSLVELGDGRIGMIYEASPTTSWADGLRYMYYEEFTMSELTAN